MNGWDANDTVKCPANNIYTKFSLYQNATGFMVNFWSLIHPSNMTHIAKIYQWYGQKIAKKFFSLNWSFILQMFELFGRFLYILFSSFAWNKKLQDHIWFLRIIFYSPQLKSSFSHQINSSISTSIFFLNLTIKNFTIDYFFTKSYQLVALLKERISS